MWWKTGNCTTLQMSTWLLIWLGSKNKPGCISHFQTKSPAILTAMGLKQLSLAHDWHTLLFWWNNETKHLLSLALYVCCKIKRHSFPPRYLHNFSPNTPSLQLRIYGGFKARKYGSYVAHPLHLCFSSVSPSGARAWLCFSIGVRVMSTTNPAYYWTHKPHIFDAYFWT